MVSVGSLDDKRRIMVNQSKLAGSDIFINPDLTKDPREEERSLRNLKKKKLAGSDIFINPDLTKDQREEERSLRNLKKKMMQSKKYQGKHITVFRGKIYKSNHSRRAQHD